MPHTGCLQIIMPMNYATLMLEFKFCNPEDGNDFFAYELYFVLQRPFVMCELFILIGFLIGVVF